MGLIMSCFSIYILKEYLDTFLIKTKTNWRHYVKWMFFAVWQIMYILNVIKIPEHYILIIIVFAVLLISSDYEGDIFRKILFSLAYNSIWMLAEILLIFIFTGIGLNFESQELLGSFITKVFLFLMVEALKHFLGNENIMDLPHPYNMILILIPLGSMLIVYTSFLMNANIQSLFRVMLNFASLFILLCINVLIFTIYSKLSQDIELRQKNVVYKQEIEIYNKQIKVKKNSMSEFRKAKHDLKNQLIFLLEQCEKNEYEKMKQFLKQLIDIAPFDKLIISKTDNSVVDALVNYKYTIAKHSGIEFSVKLEIPTSLPFDSADMCIILGNALDNALEANIKVNFVKRYIKLNMRMEMNNLAIIVENSFDGKIKRNKRGKIMTVKTNQIDHGHGLNSIQRAVNKYHGFMNISYLENVFILEIVLYGEKKYLQEI